MTTVDESLKQVFCSILGVNIDKITDDIQYNSFQNWDSLRHFRIVASIEEEFGIEFLFEDITAMKSFKDVKRIVKKYLKETNMDLHD